MNDYQSNESMSSERGAKKACSAKKTISLILAIISIILAIAGIFSNIWLTMFGYVLCAPAFVTSIVAIVLKSKVGIAGLALSVLGLIVTAIDSIAGILVLMGVI